MAYLVSDGAESWGVQFLDVESATWTRRSDLVLSPTFQADIAWDRGSSRFGTAWGDQSVRVWDPATAQLVAEHAVPEEHGVAVAVGFSDDGSRVVVGTDEGWVHTFGTTSGESVGPPIHLGAMMPPDRGVPVYSIHVDADGSRVLASVGGTLHLMDPLRGRVLRSRDLGFVMDSFVRSPVDGTVTVSGDLILRWGSSERVATLDPETLESLPGPPSAVAVKNLGLSRDGSTLLGTGERDVSLTAMDGRGSLGTLHVGDGGLGGHFFSSAVLVDDDSRVLIASEQGGLFLWDPDPDTATRAACRMAGRGLTDEEWQTYLPDREPFEVCPQ